MTEPCQCPNSGYCERFGRPMTQRTWEICADRCPPENPCLPPNDSESYRKLWEGPKGKEIAAAVNYVPPPPRWWYRYWTFTRALWRHVRHGLPTASPADRAARWAICEPCEYRDRDKNQCRQCGCSLPPGQMLSKIAWAGESCPLLGKRAGPWWGPVAGEKVWTRAARWLQEKETMRGASLLALVLLVMVLELALLLFFP